MDDRGDKYSKFMLTVSAVLLLVVAMTLWCQSPTVLPGAYGGIPDSGYQLNQILITMEHISASLDRIEQLLTCGKAKATVTIEHGGDSYAKPIAQPKK